MLTPDRSAARRRCRLSRTALITPSVKLLIMFGYGSRGFIDYQCRFVLISLGSATSTAPHRPRPVAPPSCSCCCCRNKLFARHQLQWCFNLCHNWLALFTRPQSLHILGQKYFHRQPEYLLRLGMQAWVRRPAGLTAVNLFRIPYWRFFRYPSSLVKNIK